MGRQFTQHESTRHKRPATGRKAAAATGSNQRSRSGALPVNLPPHTHQALLSAARAGAPACPDGAAARRHNGFELRGISADASRALA
jgi:hypothetical protein